MRNRLFKGFLTFFMVCAMVVGFVPMPQVQAANELIPDGDYVIWVPAYNVALSGTYGGYYNVATPVAMAGDTLTGYDDDDIWTVKNNPDGTLTITHDGKKLAMGAEFSSLTLDEVYSAWRPQSAGNGLFYLKNTGRNCFVEYYAQKGYWSGYGRMTNDTAGMFALQFTPVVKGHETAEEVRRTIALWDGSFSRERKELMTLPGELFPGLGLADEAAALTVTANGEAAAPYAKEYLGGAVGAAEGDFVQMEMPTLGWGDIDFSFRAKSRAGSYQAYRVCWSADGQNFFDLGNGAITPGQDFESYAFSLPALAEDQQKIFLRLEASGSAQAGSDLQLTDLTFTASPIVEEGRVCHVTVNPSSEFAQQKGMPLTMSCATEGAQISYRINAGQWQAYDEANKPVIGDLPMGLEVKATKEGMTDSPVSREYYRAGAVQSVTLSVSGSGVYIPGSSLDITLQTGTEDAKIYYATSNDGKVFGQYQLYTQPLTLMKGFGTLTVRAYAQKPGFDDSTVITHTYTERTTELYNIYFGQLHSHTTISDGAGTVNEAFRYAHEVENLDFLAVTDHSNSFDNANAGVLNVNSSSSVEWQEGHKAADSVTDGTFVGIYGFEMTWSNGLGHINTFNTPGWQSRTQGDYAQYATAVQNYYAALATVPESISQFNHPGTTFGDFSDFGHYSQVNDSLITLIEVGNGSGAIGSSGYFPSYEYYTRALDKGWHVAPSNNQDNHRGMWGDSNTARTVALADELTREAIFDALRNCRVYATEDNDLNIYYTLNGQIMGSVIPAGQEQILSVAVDLSDATDSAIGKVEVIVNGGLSIDNQTLETSQGRVEFTVPADYDYYYLRITQPDGDIAVTAPVWVGQVEAVGIASVRAEKPMTLTQDSQRISMELYNNEAQPLFINSIVFTDETTGEVIYTEEQISSVPNTGTAVCEFDHTFRTSGLHKVTATVMGLLGSEQRSYTASLELMVMPGDMVSRIIVDGTHYNDYVTGYYAGKVNNMAILAADMDALVHVEKEKITAEQLETCDLLVISAPSKKAEEGYPMSEFEPEFVALVASYVKNGGSVVICGLADYQDRRNDGIHETSVQLNLLLEAMESTLRINDDEAMDEVKNGGNPYRLYPTTFNMDSPWLDDLQPRQQYSQYGGCSVDPGEGTWLVKGHNTTQAIDSDKDGDGGVRPGEVVFLACEQTPYGGTVFAAGGVFLSDYEIEEDPDAQGYVNQTVYRNILASLEKPVTVTPIADVRESVRRDGLGSLFVVEGFVTAGTDQKSTTFYDTVYLQDATGGICLYAFNPAGLKPGAKLRVVGYTDVFQEDVKLQVISYELLKDEKQVQEPKTLDCAAAADYDLYGGQLVRVEGVVTAVTPTAEGVGLAQLTVLDEQGNSLTVFIDGYIYSATTGKNDLAQRIHVGAQVSCVGLCYRQPGEAAAAPVTVLRVRNCDEVTYLGEGVLPEPVAEAGSDSGWIWILVIAVAVIAVAAVAVIVIRKKGEANDAGQETE